MKFLQKKLKKLDILDMALIKLAVFAFALALISGWLTFTNWVVSISWWWFALAWILLAIRPVKRAWF